MPDTAPRTRPTGWPKSGNFERVLFLPAPIDPEIVSASYSNGFLEIRLAKQPVERIRKVSISE